MRPTAATPTRPANYALISAVYATAFGATVAASGRTGELPTQRELLPLGLATSCYTRVVTQQKVEEWLRRPFVEEPPDAPWRPRGRGLRYAVGELLLCTRCTGAWVGLGLVALRVAAPRAGRLAAATGTVGTVNDAAQAAFAWLRSR